MPKTKKKSTNRIIRNEAKRITEQIKADQINYLVGIHGELFRHIITGFTQFCDAYGQGCLLSFPAGRELALKDLIFRLAPPDLLEKHKEPRAPDWVLDAQEKVRQINIHIHEVNRQAKEIEKLTQELEEVRAQIGQPVRHRLPDTRHAVTHKFNVGGHEGYMTVGMFGDGAPGELFVTMAKEGSTIGGLMDTIGTLTSLALQYGVSIETLATKFAYQRFEPSGYTNNAEIKMASSIIDYVFRWLEIYFVKSRVPTAAPEATPEEPLKLPTPKV
jgi:hypothetical protein